MVLAPTLLSPITGVGWKLTVQDNGVDYQDSNPPGGFEHFYGIYTVSSFIDSQHFSVTMNPVPNNIDTLTTTIYTMDTYSSPTPVSFANAYTAYPQVIRLTSTGDIVLGEAWYQMARRIWLSGPNANTVTRIGVFGDLAIASNLVWYWHDIDDVGACGPVDDIVMFKADSNPGSAAVIWCWAIDGSYNGRFYGDSTGAVFEEGFGGGGHYPWAFAFSKTQARILSMGESDTGVYSWRPLQAGDPPLTYDQTIGPAGLANWTKGTIPVFRLASGRHSLHYTVNPVRIISATTFCRRSTTYRASIRPMPNSRRLFRAAPVAPFRVRNTASMTLKTLRYLVATYAI